MEMFARRLDGVRVYGEALYLGVNNYNHKLCPVAENIYI